MELEYTRYLFIQNILQKLHTTFATDNYRIKNLIELWIIEFCNNRGINSLEHTVADFSKQLEILSARKNKRGRPAQEVIEILIFMHNRYIENYKNFNIYKNNFNKPYEFTVDTFKYYNFERYIGEERLKKLRKFSTDGKIAHMVMRYGVIISSSQHWAIPRDIYKKFIEIYSVDFEAFASPLNSQMMMLSSRNSFPFPKQVSEKYEEKTSFGKGTKQVSEKYEEKTSFGKGIYGSLFYDTDKYFGSAGSFFDLPHKFFIGRKVVVNPPFTYEIIEKSIKFCIEVLSTLLSEINKGTNEFVKGLSELNKGTLFLFSLPIWVEEEYAELLKSKYIIKKSKYTKCRFETPENIIENNTGTIWFIMANYKVNNLNELDFLF